MRGAPNPCKALRRGRTGGAVEEQVGQLVAADEPVHCAVRGVCLGVFPCMWGPHHPDLPSPLVDSPHSRMAMISSCATKSLSPAGRNFSIHGPPVNSSGCPAASAPLAGAAGALPLLSWVCGVGGGGRKGSAGAKAPLRSTRSASFGWSGGVWERSVCGGMEVWAALRERSPPRRQEEVLHYMHQPPTTTRSIDRSCTYAPRVRGRVHLHGRRHPSSCCCRCDA